MAQEYLKGVMSSGEVVLIDTRQHWMAAVRFALKPILLLIGVVLLALLNNWLDFDGALSFINDIVSFLLIIAAIVAVIWLPIDLVRWYSRHYVLTSRRAIRMQGVFRKQSFDSSLEQINDIAFSQSVLGRALGYADLTLYTASDTANESYEQLMDGLQFKKAVLDAKEGIRQGAPLTGLAEGFIVKGGTNEASMRADGKLQAPTTATEGEQPAAADPDAAAADAPYEGDPLARLDEPAASAAQPEPAPAAPPPPAPEPAEPSAPEPVAEPAVVAESEPEPAPVPAAEPAPESDAVPAPDDRSAETAEAWPAADPAAHAGDSPADETPAQTDEPATQPDDTAGSDKPA